MTEQEKDQLIEQQEEKIASLENELEATLKVNEDLVKQIEEGAKAPADVAAISEETFEIDGKKVGFAFRKMKHNGHVITPAEVLASEDLQKELYEQQSGMLKLL